MVHPRITFVFQNLLKDEATLKVPIFSSAISYNSFSFFDAWINSYNPVPAKRFLNKEPNNRPKNRLFYSFVSFLIVLVTPFNKILESWRAWTIFIMSFISSFEIIKDVVPEKYFRLNFCINRWSSCCYS